MTDLSPEWTEVACFVADVIRHSEHTTVYASHTDIGGEHGAPEIYTEWGIKDHEVPVLREYRFLPYVEGQPDRKPCEHYVPTRPASADPKGTR